MLKVPWNHPHHQSTIFIKNIKIRNTSIKKWDNTLVGSISIYVRTNYCEERCKAASTRCDFHATLTQFRATFWKLTCEFSESRMNLRQNRMKIALCGRSIKLAFHLCDCDTIAIRMRCESGKTDNRSIPFVRLRYECDTNVMWMWWESDKTDNRSISLVRLRYECDSKCSMRSCAQAPRNTLSSRLQS